jgi:hypothetical protein
MFQEIPQDSDIDTSMTTIEGKKFMTDSNIQSQGFHHTIIEVKNEIGSKGAEPHAQAISYYINYCKSSVTRMIDFRFPCILIMPFSKLSIFHCQLSLMLTTSSGAHIDFSAAVWSTLLNIQVLFDHPAPLLAPHRHQNMHDSCTSFWCPEKCPLFIGTML